MARKSFGGWFIVLLTVAASVVACGGSEDVAAGDEETVGQVLHELGTAGEANHDHHRCFEPSSADSTLRQGAPSANLGASNELIAVGSTVNEYAPLVKWDTSIIATDSSVSRATISLDFVNSSSRTLVGNGLLRGWSETQVTWNQAKTGSAWGLPGAKAKSDRDARTAFSFVAPTEGFKHATFTAAGLQLVQSWIASPATNHGVILSTTSRSIFKSKEGADYRPLLCISYRSN